MGGGLGIAEEVQALLNHRLCDIHPVFQLAGGKIIRDLRLVGDFRTAHQVQTQHNALLHRLNEAADPEERRVDHGSDHDQHDQQREDAFFHGKTSLFIPRIIQHRRAFVKWFFPAGARLAGICRIVQILLEKRRNL